MTPFKLRYDGGEKPWKIVNANTGRVVCSSENRHQAEASMIHRVIAQPAGRTFGIPIVRPPSPSRPRYK